MGQHPKLKTENENHSMITTTSDSEDDLIKEFKKDLELSKNDYSDSDSSHSSKISVIEQSGTYYKKYLYPYLCLQLKIMYILSTLFES